MTSMSNHGEMDYSFFDSEHDDATDGVDVTENDGLKAEEESPPAHESTDGTETALATREGDHEDENSQSSDESEEKDESLAITTSNIDADSESSCSNSSWKSSLDSHTSPRYDEQPSCSGVSRTRVGSAGSADMPVGSTEDTWTDVTPCSSPDISPLHSLNLNSTEEGWCDEEQQQQQEESVPSSGLSDMHHDVVSYQDVVECCITSKSQRGELVFFCPGRKNRKNYSFRNEQVKVIDTENQRLHQSLTEIYAGPRPGSAAWKKAHMIGKLPLKLLTANRALNRQREQQRIERDNLMFQKRLESVKPSPGMKRAEQLKDYQRLSGYFGASFNVCAYPTRREVNQQDILSRFKASQFCPPQLQGRLLNPCLQKVPVSRSKITSATKPT